ncbi:hypothetical protein JCM30237_11700 [Halolamina litorea]|uniref:Uncharacterized protein n=1 Tax=Halolamina litorea TaxID=1515593 RepID=A0ABD6BLT1_9EURY|nr:hypothetical protein [Halolamina litorea]
MYDDVLLPAASDGSTLNPTARGDATRRARERAAEVGVAARGPEGLERALAGSAGETGGGVPAAPVTTVPR